jgi:repressor LexA
MTPVVSDRQRRILEFIVYATKRGYPPTIREIGDHVGLLSTSSVSYQLRRLEEMGLVHRSPARARGLVVTAAARPFIVKLEMS